MRGFSNGFLTSSFVRARIFGFNTIFVLVELLLVATEEFNTRVFTSVFNPGTKYGCQIFDTPMLFQRTVLVLNI